MSVLRKRQVEVSQAGEPRSLPHGAFGADYPLLWEMLTATRYPDGSARRTSSLTIFVDEGMCKVCLNDRDNGLTGWSAARDVLEALGSMEGALAADTVGWRESGATKGKRR